MVSLSKLRGDLPFLFFKKPVSSFEDLIDFQSGDQIELAKKINFKERKTFAELKYLSWVRHSLSFLKKETSPEVILKSWSDEVHSLLELEWKKVFEEDAPYALASMGKLGSNELNLSSDIDLIFFAEEGARHHKLRDFIATCSASVEVPSGFKIDLDLRPGGKHAPLLSTSHQLGVHLWNQSDPWERYSYTRMQVKIGGKTLKQKLKDVRDKFCYRRHLSTHFFHSFLTLREEYKVEESSSSVNLKLGAGGIRDVELFVQTFQILYGGRNVKFREKSTFQTLDLLKEEGVHQKIFEDLKKAYLVLRHAEGEFHALNEHGGFEWKKESSVLDEYILQAMKVVRESIKDFSESSSNLFGQSSKNIDHVYFKNQVLKSVPEERREAAESNLENYFSDKNKMFSFYRKAILSQKDMLSAFVDLLAYSGYGCKILSRRPSLLDMFFLRRNLNAENENTLFENLSDMKMIHRILASNSFSKSKNLSDLSKQIADSYEYILKQIIKPDEGVDLLFTGKMATREMSLKSDLDFIIVTDKNVNFSKEYLNKKARSLYKKLSYTTIFGPLVPFDKDGGPMGSASPIVIELESLERHLKEKAPTWQKLMYLKHRFLFSPEKRLDFLSEPIEEKNFKELFDILKERLNTLNRHFDPLKLNPGGLFHTEFILSALVLKIGKQPINTTNIKELCSALTEYFKEEALFKEISKNYEALFQLREEKTIENQDQAVGTDGVQLNNFKILEDLSVKYLFGNQVGRAK